MKRLSDIVSEKSTKIKLGGNLTKEKNELIKSMSDKSNERIDLPNRYIYSKFNSSTSKSSNLSIYESKNEFFIKNKKHHRNLTWSIAKSQLVYF